MSIIQVSLFFCTFLNNYNYKKELITELVKDEEYTRRSK